MSRKLIVKCDKCGKETENFWVITFEHTNALKTCSGKNEGPQVVSEWCEECVNKEMLNVKKS